MIQAIKVRKIKVQRKLGLSKSFFKSILLSLLFFPSITFGLFQAEIFPWAAILYFLLYKRKNYEITIVMIFLLLSLSATLGIVFSNNENYLQIFRSIAAYINAITGFYIVKREFSLDKSNSQAIAGATFVKTLICVFVIINIIGILQSLNLIVFWDDFFKIIIPRGSSVSLIEIGGRGVRLLDSEPSRAAKNYIMLAVIVRTYFFGKKINLYASLFDAYIVSFVFLFLRASTAIPYILIMLLLSNRRLLIVLFFSFTSYFFYSFASDSRILSTLVDIKNASSLSELFLEIIVVQSGFRFISVYSAFIYGFTHPFGGFVGNWKQSSIYSMELSGFDASLFTSIREQIDPSEIANSGFASLRPTSFASSLFLDLGCVGVLLFLVIFYLGNKKIFSKVKKKNFLLKNPLFILPMFSILFLGDIGDPITWATLSSSFFLREKLSK